LIGHQYFTVKNRQQAYYNTYTPVYLNIDISDNLFYIVIKNRLQIKRIPFIFTKLLVLFKIWAIFRSSKVWENGRKIIPIFANNKWERSFSV